MMNTLTRWEPLREMEDLQSRLSTLFGRTPVRRGNGKESITLPEWTPLADITEDDMEYVIKAELPELRREDVKVTVENGVLTISGERKLEKEEKKKKYHRVERGYGSFVRTFALPEDANEDETDRISCGRTGAAHERERKVTGHSCNARHHDRAQTNARSLRDGS